MKNILILLFSLISFVGYSQIPIDPSVSMTTGRYNAAVQGSVPAGGTNTYTGSLTGVTSYTNLCIDITFTNASTTTPCTFNLNSLGARTLKKFNSSGSLTDFTTGDIFAGQRLRFYDNGSFLVVESGGSSGGGAGTVTSVSVTTANGVSGSVANATTTPAISLTLGAITPTTVNGVILSGSSTPTLSITGTTTVSGTNTGDQTNITGNAATVTTIPTLSGDVSNSGNTVTVTQVNGASLNASRTVTTTASIVQGDNLHVVYLNGSSPFNFTIDALTIGTNVTLINVGSATVTFVNGSGVTFSGPSIISAGDAGNVIYQTSTSPLIRVSSTTPDATNTVKGIAKLYTSTGTNVDGTMDQNSITSNLATKQATGLSPLLASGGALTGNYTISGSFKHSISNAQSANNSKAIDFTPTLTATANGDILHALTINPTFTLGAFTGTTSMVLKTGPGLVLFGNAAADVISSSTTRVEIRGVTSGQVLRLGNGAANTLLARFDDNGLIGFGAAPAVGTHFGVTNQSSSTNIVQFKNSGGLQKFTVAETGDIIVDRIMTAAGTTGAQTINRSEGSVNFAAAATTLVVTNSLATTTSNIFVTVYGTDVTAKTATVTRASGSFTITLNAAATAETAVGFIVHN